MGSEKSKKEKANERRKTFKKNFTITFGEDDEQSGKQGRIPKKRSSPQK